MADFFRLGARPVDHNIKPVDSVYYEPLAGEFRVLPAYAGSEKLNFTVREYIGGAITKVGLNGMTLLSPAAIEVGEEILVPSLSPDCYHLMHVVEKTGNSAVAAGQESGFEAVLHFDGDDRHCWVCTGLMNTAAIKRIDFQ